MKGSIRKLAMTLVLVTFLLGMFAPLMVFSSSDVPPQAVDNYPVRLRVITFTPTLGETPAFSDKLQINSYDADKMGYYLVQFTGPIKPEWKDALAAMGVEVMGYIPEFTFKVRMYSVQAAQVRTMENVAWVGYFHPAYKLSPELKKAEGGKGLYRVQVESGRDVAAIAKTMDELGVEILTYGGADVVVAADAAQLESVAQILDVAWVDNFTLYEKHNEYGGGGIMGANTAFANGYNGSTQVVAVADTGLGGGTAATAHRDLASSRVTAIYNWPGVSDSCWTITDDGAKDVDSGHGTHTAMSVVSAGGASGEGKGTAPSANLVFQAVENYADMKGTCALYYPDGYYLTGLPTDLSTLFLQAYNAGARIHSNSWGSDEAGAYTTDSQSVDSFIWNHKDMLITFSGGNAGIDSNSDGVIDNGSIGAPATAKNALSVGASENDRQGHWECDTSLSYVTCTGQNDIFTWGGAWPSDYPANPIFSDVSAGNAQQMAAFSSRGPVDDGRIKPDVVAPGSWILSGYSNLYQQSYDSSANPVNGAWQYDGYGYPLNAYYKYMSGTSMSNPLAAGAAATVRDYYKKTYSIDASAALVKAALINSATDMSDENNDGVNDNDYPIPNNHEGWGLINMANATDSTGDYRENSAGLSTGGSVAYQFTVGVAGSAFKVTAVWSDYPSTTSASKNLVNDLDVVVTSPSGTTYKGNVFSGGWSATGGVADHTNNVENVYVQSAAAGVWTVTVSGYNVSQGPQPFALVVDGSLSTGPTPTATTVTPTNTPTVTPTPTNTPTPTPTATPGAGDLIYASSSSDGAANGVSFADEDILVYNTAAATWAMYFDGSDVGITTDIDGFYLMADGTVLLSFDATTTVTGLGTVYDADIVRFTPTATGATTAGSFAWYFDGSDVGLSASGGEDIDAIGFAPDGRLILSTGGSVSVTGVSGADEDLLAFTPTALGATTSGTWAMYFDGSDVALTATNEDINGVWIDATNGQIYLTTTGAFAVTGASGDGADIFVCTPGTLGSTTTCTFSMYWDGSVYGFSGEITDDITIVR